MDTNPLCKLTNFFSVPQATKSPFVKSCEHLSHYEN